MFAHAASPTVEAGEGDADGFVAEGFESGQGQGLDGGVPVDVDGGVVVEQSGQGAGHELAQRVAQETGFVEELPFGLVAAFGDQGGGGLVEESPQLGDGGFLELSVSGVVAGEVCQCGFDDYFVGGPKRDVVVADALGSD